MPAAIHPAGIGTEGTHRDQRLLAEAIDQHQPVAVGPVVSEHDVGRPQVIDDRTARDQRLAEDPQVVAHPVAQALLTDQSVEPSGVMAVPVANLHDDEAEAEAEVGLREANDGRP